MGDREAKTHTDGAHPTRSQAVSDVQADQARRSVFQQATDKQREVYGWRTKRSVRWVRSPFCKQCRTNSLKRKRRQARTVEIKQNPHYRLMLQLQEKRKTTIRHERDAYNPHAKEFYAKRAQALTRAIQTVEHLLDTSPTTPYPRRLTGRSYLRRTIDRHFWTPTKL